MTSTVMKVEIETETCCVCGGGGDLMTPEEHDVGAPPMQVPLRSMLLHLNNSKVVPDGRLCASCIRRTLEAYEFSTALSNRAVPPLSEKIRALRRRLHELTQKIDVFIVVGGGGVGAGGSYSEEDIIMVERGPLAAAAAADDEDLERARNAKGDTVYQCSVCPLSFQRVSEYRAHASSHGADALHSCWTCGAQFTTRLALTEHNRQHHQQHQLHTQHLTCHLCHTTYQSQSELRRHEGAGACAARCPACGLQCGSRAALSAHVTSHHGAHSSGEVYVCAWCYVTCDTSDALAAHTLRHRQAKQFVCGYDGCILRFGTRSYLMSHIRKCHVSEEQQEESSPTSAAGAGAGAATGTGTPTAASDAPVPCQHCTRTFGSVAAMKRHSRVHRNVTLAQDDMEVQNQQGEESEGMGEGDSMCEGEGEIEYLEVETLEDLEYQDMKPPLHHY